MTARRKTKTIVILLLVGSLFAALKSVFVSLQMDEEYAISLSYRMLKGDRMFTQVWDPHQTSAFLAEFLMWIFVRLFRTTTGVVIWLRFWGTVIHGVIAYRVYRGMKEYVSVEHSFYLGILYFNFLPKGYIIPEFSNMLIWSLTLLLLCLHSPKPEKRVWVAIESAFWMCVMVLSYPSTVLLFPFFVWHFWKSGEDGKRQALLFAGVCLLAAIGYLAYLFSYMSPQDLLLNIKCLLQGNGGHTEAGIAGRLSVYWRDVEYMAIFGLAYGAVTWGCMKLLERWKKTGKALKSPDKEEKRALSVLLLVGIVLFSEVLHWLLVLWEYEYSYHYAVYFVLPVLVYRLRGALEDRVRRTAGLWMKASVLMLICVLILTNLTVFATARYYIPGTVMGFVALLSIAQKKSWPVFGKAVNVLLVFWCFVAIFLKGWEYSDNEGRLKNAACVRGIISEGPATGIFTEYMQSYMQESLFHEMQQYVNRGEKVLILDMNTISYLYQDVEVASYTTICNPLYNEALTEYYRLNPGKYPDVVIVPCWYGELRWDEESWIMKWIEKEFGAEQITDGTFYRYYRK